MILGKGCFLLALIWMLILSSMPIVNAESIWWNLDWKYRRRIDIIENSGYSLTNFPVEVTFEHGGKVQPDGGDIRVVVEGIEIPNHVSSLNSTHANIIFEVNVTASAIRSVYVYYGNPHAIAPNYPKVSLKIVEGQTGHAIIDDAVYIGWDHTSWGYVYGSGNIVTVWNDFRIDFNRNSDPSDDKDLITDWSSWKGGIGRHFRGDTLEAIGLGPYQGFVRTPIYVDINFLNAKLRVYKNHPWIETTQADFLYMVGPSWDYANYGRGSEQNIIDGKDLHPPEDLAAGWNEVLISPSDTKWVALRDSSSGIIFSLIGVGVGTGYKWILSVKEAQAWDRVCGFAPKPLAPMGAYDQPPSCKIYWYADNSNGYSNVEVMAGIFNNQPSTLVLNEEEFFPLPHVEIDEAYVSDDRVDVGSTQSIGFHARWSHNNSDIVGGTVYVNGTAYATDESGWIAFNYSSPIIGKRSWSITSVNVNGVTLYRQIAKNPSIIWDRVNIQLAVSSPRVAVGSSVNISWSGVYEYDGSPFHGVAFFNDTLTKPTIGRYGYTIGSITDPLYGLTVFRANEVYCIFDRIRAETNIETLTLGSVQVTLSLSFEYDGFPVEDAVVKVNDRMARNLGNGIYSVSLSSWMPYLTISIKAERVGFDPLVIDTTSYALGNIILYSSSIAVFSMVALRLNTRRIRRKRWLMNAKQLEELVTKSGRIRLKEASEAIGIDAKNIKTLLFELIKEGRIKGSFTSDGEGFVTDERLEEEIRGGLG